MKSNDHRNLVTAKVQEQFARYRSFTDLPVVKFEIGNRVIELDDLNSEPVYVAALFKIFDLDPTFSLIGREGNRIITG